MIFCLRKSLKLILILGLGLMSFVSCQQTKESSRKVNSTPVITEPSDYQKYIEESEAHKSVEPQHRTQFYFHKTQDGAIQKTEFISVIIHGLTMSPNDFEVFALNLFGKGHNVINLRLAKHF